MSHDLVIRNGNIVDGTGVEPHRGDIAVDGDRISELGRVEGRGREEIEADGLIVTPGFVDLHTHLDAQIGWDPMLTSVSWHGVTTVLMGNCGVTFAPCRPTDHEFLAGMMETVEDIPKRSILSGLPWDWESYGGYLDSIEALNPAINVAGLVGHSAVRFYVMGERSIEEQPTPDEIRQIAELAGQSVKDGAVGFSTNRFPPHALPDGRSIPGTFAEPDELLAVAKAVGAEGGIMQTIMNMDEMDRELDLLEKEARLSCGVLFSFGAGRSSRLGNRVDEWAKPLRAEGLEIAAVAIPRSGGPVMGLSSELWPTPGWDALKPLDLEARLAALSDSETRAKLVREAIALPDAMKIASNTYWMGDGERPVYTQKPEESLLHLAEAAGEHPVETWLRMGLESDGRTLFQWRWFNLNQDALAELITTDWAMPGLGDSGAHVSLLIDSGWATFVLSHWYRDAGLYSLGEAVKRVSGQPAQVLRLSDRGTLAPGQRADINVIDIDRLAECMPYMAYDFPFGAPRFVQRAVGYKATLCNGQVIVRDDELTGARAGTVLRS